MLLCQMCQTEIKGYRKLWCSDRCQDKANRTLREEEEYIQRVLDLQKNVQLINTNQIELLGKDSNRLLKYQMKSMECPCNISGCEGCIYLVKNHCGWCDMDFPNSLSNYIDKGNCCRQCINRLAQHRDIKGRYYDIKKLLELK
jgi:hypothetical protein